MTFKVIIIKVNICDEIALYDFYYCKKNFYTNNNAL